MQLSVRGIYRQGAIELTEPIDGISESDVIVTFIQPQESIDKLELRKRFVERMIRGVHFVGLIPTREDLYAERVDKFL